MGRNKVEDREVPEDQSRPQIKLFATVRSYIRQRSDDTGGTYSEVVDGWLPDEIEDDVHAVPDEEIVRFRPTPAIHDKIDRLAGPRVSHAEVIAFYAMCAAVENGDVDVAAEFVDLVPRELLDVVVLAARPDDASTAD